MPSQGMVSIGLRLFASGHGSRLEFARECDDSCRWVDFRWSLEPKLIAAVCGADAGCDSKQTETFLARPSKNSCMDVMYFVLHVCCRKCPWRWRFTFLIGSELALGSYPAADTESCFAVASFSQLEVWASTRQAGYWSVQREGSRGCGLFLMIWARRRRRW